MLTTGPLSRAFAPAGALTGAGIGLKPQHVEALLQQRPALGFVEIHAENYLMDGGPYHRHLTRVREHYALSIHGVSLSIGGTERPDRAHLKALRRLLDRYQPAAFSEHLAWSSHADIYYNDLLPVAYNEQTLQRVCDHLQETQEALKRRLLLENPSTYVEFASSTLSETAFLAEVVRRTGCGLLLDVCNVIVSSTNHGRDPYAYLASLPLEAVGEIHLAGFDRQSDSLGAPLLIDFHGAAVATETWQLYDEALRRCGAVATLIEWDTQVPELPVLLAEANRASARMQHLVSEVEPA